MVMNHLDEATEDKIIVISNLYIILTKIKTDIPVTTLVKKSKNNYKNERGVIHFEGTGI